MRRTESYTNIQIKEEDEDEEGLGCEDQSTETGGNWNKGTPSKTKQQLNFDSSKKEGQEIRDTAYDEAFFHAFDYYLDQAIQRMKEQEEGM